MSTSSLEAPYGSHAHLVAGALGVDITTGLATSEALRRHQRDGPNSLEVTRVPPWWLLLLRQFTSVVVWLLMAAAVVSWFTDSRVESAAILVVLGLNASIGFWIEWRANRALSALHYEAKTTARVLRDGNEDLIDAALLVAGDIIILNPGDRVPADARLLEATSLKVDESTFTGESVPVNKSAEPVDVSSILADRCSMIYLGTLVVAGRATAVVTATGSYTELGRIGRLMQKTLSERTPLEQKLERLGGALVYVVLIIAAIVFAAGYLRGDEPWLMAKVAISLAVAAVPEALPAMTTLILALGVLEMARRRAIVRRLAAVETLGSTTVICSDKTGTLTENRMTVTEFRLADGERFSLTNSGPPPVSEDLALMLETSILCNEATLPAGTGDPTEIALLVAATKCGVDPVATRADNTKLLEEPFDPTTKRMIIACTSPRFGAWAHLKGGPSAVLEICTDVLVNGARKKLTAGTRHILLGINEQMADRGLRVLAFARKKLSSVSPADIREGYTFLGFAGMTDPPRDGAADAISDAWRAGIRVVMLTGDQLLTARAIARELNLSHNHDVSALHANELPEDEELLLKAVARAHVFARVSPTDKLRIVEALQQEGEIVAVTGDGINDAPALKRADIGIAMGLRGTEVAKEAADIVLTDDNFSTIVNAIEGGRRIYANIIKFVHLLFSHNLGEVGFIFGAMMFNLPLPLMPLQILWINIVTDVFPAFALAVEPADPDSMNRPPRRKGEAIVSAGFLALILWQGAMLAAVALGAYVWAVDEYGPGAHARTVALLAVVGGQLGHLFNCRSRTRSTFRGFFGNPFIFVAVGAIIILQALAVYFPPLRQVLGTTAPNIADIAVFAVCVAVPVIIVEAAKAWMRK